MTSAADLLPPSSPWLSVWLKPRGTIERILATNPRRHVLLLAGLGGISAIPVDWIDAGLTTQVLDWPKPAAIVVLGVTSVVLGAVIGIVNLYFFAFLLGWSG